MKMLYKTNYWYGDRNFGEVWKFIFKLNRVKLESRCCVLLLGTASYTK